MSPYCLRTKRDYKFEIKHVPILSEDKQKLNFEIIDVPIKSGDTQINMANVPTASLPYIINIFATANNFLERVRKMKVMKHYTSTLLRMCSYCLRTT